MKLQFPSPMKSTICLALLLALGSLAQAQEAIPLEEAQKAARKLIATIGTASDLPFTMEADVERPAGLKGGEAGVIVLPDKSLNAAAVAAAGKTFVPVGQLWSLKVTLASGGRGFSSDKLRLVSVGDGERTREVQFFLLGVVKNEQGALELAVFGKGAEPLYRVALQKAGSGSQNLPLELTGTKTGEESARLTLSVLGQYTADLDLVKAD